MKTGQHYALDDLRQSFTLFGSDYFPAGQVAALTVRLDAARLVNDDILFKETSTMIDSMRGTPGWTSFTDVSIGQERAEWLRIRGSLSEARSLNDRVVAGSRDYPIHLGLGLLRRAEIERSCGEDNKASIRELQSLLERHPMAYLDAHLGITECRSGMASAEDCLSHVLASCPLLGTRTGDVAVSPIDYCLGDHATQHELFLP